MSHFLPSSMLPYLTKNPTESQREFCWRNLRYFFHVVFLLQICPLFPLLCPLSMPSSFLNTKWKEARGYERERAKSKEADKWSKKVQEWMGERSREVRNGPLAPGLKCSSCFWSSGAGPSLKQPILAQTFWNNLFYFMETLYLEPISA